MSTPAGLEGIKVHSEASSGASKVDHVPKPLDLKRFQIDGIPPIPWMAEPYLVQGEIHLLVGDGYTGKTYLALDTALGLAAGQNVFIDRPLARPYRVMFLDEDGGPQQALRRILALAAGRSIDFQQSSMLERFTVFSGEGFLLDEQEGLEKLKATIRLHKPEVIVMDALRAFHAGEENDSKVMSKLLRHVLRPLAMEFALTIIMVHHTSKDAPEKGVFRRSVSNASRGSTEIRNAIDTLFYIQVVRGARALIIDKARNLAEAKKPQALAFEIEQQANGEMIRIIKAEVPSGIPRPKLAQAVKELHAALPEGGEQELSFRRLLECLPGLKGGSYSKRTAQEALSSISSHFATRQEGRNTFYRRRKAEAA